MTDEIINRVAKSHLLTIDLEDYYPKRERKIIDIKDWLFKGLILKEKEFRAQLETYNWLDYKDCYVAITCSIDAIIPTWAYMLLTTKLIQAKKIVIGDLETLETVLYQDIIKKLPIEEYINKSIIIKGCSHKPVPKNAYVFLLNKLQPVAKSIMYGEACSAVPLLKKL